MSEAYRAIERARRGSNSVTPSPAADGASWPELIPFGRLSRPPFPVDMLPRWMRLWAEEAAESFQVEVDAPATLALTVLACAAAGRYTIHVRHEWYERPALWSIIPMRSGERKTPLLAAAQAPLLAWEARARKDAEEQNARTADERDIAEARRKRLKKAAAEVEPSEREKLIREIATVAIPSVLSAPLLTICDSTPEKLVDILVQNDERIGIFSTEGEIISQILGRYSDNDAPGLNINTLLKCFSAERITCHRKAGGDVVMNGPVATIAIMTQPDMVHRLMMSAELAGRGLLARFLYSMPESKMGRRNPDPSPMQPVTVANYANVIRSILDAPRELDESRRLILRTIEFDAAAQAQMAELLGGVEPGLALGESSDLHQTIRAKWCGAVARIATLLAIGEAAGVDHAVCAVTREHVDRATEIGVYYEAHAQVAYEQFGLSPESRRAQAVLAWLRRRQTATGFVFQARDVAHQGAAGLTKMDDVEPVLAELERRHYIRRVQAARPAGTRGRHPSPWYELRSDA